MALTRLGTNAITSVPSSAITALPAGVGGKVLQMVTAGGFASTTVSSQSNVTTNIKTSITPTSTSSKIYIHITSVCSQVAYGTRSSDFIGVSLTRNIGGAGATTIRGGGNNDFLSVYQLSTHSFFRPVALSYVDTTYNSTSSIEYELLSRVESSGEATGWNGGFGGRITIMEIA